ncbi:TetR family transcriptional regulator [Streptomyces sp. H27-H1]|uniref:TetR/AcrR family transcriptional regulator n=1 Tax=Streptomyces sp. H27-H1 TaxID=2996461 RepID=UPI00226FD62E|nr:TetR family transcriptional regulator [Streptomyces sp. H27-H1]MCY0932434.1 TetR family transcriptional regulator [Streptomyces sp. H27-H1]
MNRPRLAGHATAPRGCGTRWHSAVVAAIAATALRLFLRTGFDGVSVTEIAQEAEVSRRTLFTHFPTKEDLVLHLLADHQDQVARTVQTRRLGQPPLEALREALLNAGREHDANTGLNDSPESLAFYQLVTGTESLAAKLTHYAARGIDSLADELAAAGFDALTARLTATQVIALERELANMNHQSLAGGESAADRYPKAVQGAERAYDLLHNALGSR